MIWDNDVRVIVMLTAETEGGQLKCHSYWDSREYGPVRLRMLSEKKVSLDLDEKASEFPSETGRRRANTTTSAGLATSPTPRPQAEAPHVIIRKFALSHSAHPFEPMREVTHLHFPSWPDFGVPARASHLLALVELANVMQRAALPLETTAITSPRRTSSFTAPTPTSPAAAAAGASTPGTPWPDEPESSSKARPMLVHCSAGCGRTGTFCTVDSVIDMLKRQRMEKLSKFIRKEDEDAVMEDVPDLDGGVATSRRPLDGTARRESNGTPLSGALAASRRESTAAEPEVDTSWMGDEDVDLIQRTVEDFRGQRLSMVQSLRQFVLCYETVLEWVWRAREGAERKRSGSLGGVPRG